MLKRRVLGRDSGSAETEERRQLRREQRKRIAAAVARRIAAARSLRAGNSVSKVAIDVGASRSTVNAWNKILQLGGVSGLRRYSLGGPRSRLGEREEGFLKETAAQVPQTPDGLPVWSWTLPLLQQALKRRFNQTYDKVTIWRKLKALGLLDDPSVLSRAKGQRLTDDPPRKRRRRRRSAKPG